MRALGIVNFSAVPEPVFMPVSAVGLMIIKLDCLYTKLWQSEQFIRFRNAVVIPILPQPQTGKDGVLSVNFAVAVPVVFRLVEFSQSNKTVLFLTWWW